MVHHIIGQQISTKAQATIWQRMCDALGTVHAKTVLGAGVEGLQALGISCKKAEYITDFAQKVLDGSFDIEAVWSMPDDEAIKALSSLNGIGVWTAEMILLFCMQRPNILSYGDLAIQRGMRMVYHHRKIDRKLFEKYRAGSVPIAAWPACTFGRLAGGALPDMKDYAPKQRQRPEGKRNKPVTHDTEHDKKRKEPQHNTAALSRYRGYMIEKDGKKFSHKALALQFTV